MRLVRAWIALPLLALPAGAAAQAPEPLSLERVVETALERGSGLALAEQGLAAGAGELLSASGAFATQLSSSVVRQRATEPGLAGDGTVAAEPTVVQGTYQVALTKRLRAGVLVQPEMTLTRTDLGGPGPMATTSASVGVQLVVPLWKDRGGVLYRSAERAAAAGYAADRLGWRQAAAGTVVEVVAAYWEYVAAAERARVYAESEERAQLMVEETQVLVAADERPASDLNQLRANVASKRMSRIAAEQGVVEARRRLGLAMGLGPAEVWALAPPADSLPLPEPVSVDSAAARRLVDAALANRADLAAARQESRGAEELLRAARDDLRPQLDLSVGFGYAGLETGRGLGEWVSPLYRNVPGMNTTVQLSYRLPVANSEAQGRAMQRSALAQRQRIVERDLGREIATGVTLAVEALQRSSLSAAEAGAAVELYRVTVANEREKHRLDAATLFDVILAEDALTSAGLGQVSARLGYALAVAGLRYETATLLGWEDGRPLVRADDLLRIPDASGP